MDSAIFSGPNMAVVGIAMVFVALAILVAVVSVVASQVARLETKKHRADGASKVAPTVRSDDEEAALAQVAVAAYGYHLRRRVAVRRSVAPSPWLRAGRQQQVNRIGSKG
jgi:sodium pump decarboxylase gamma subunit